MEAVSDPHDHAATDDFDPACPDCRAGWQAAYDAAQCDYREAEFQPAE
jgi:hypothetical protein